MSDKWISVKERLPEQGETVLCSWNSGYWKGTVRVGMWDGPPPRFEWNIFKPTHWQPLPAPPEAPSE